MLQAAFFCRATAVPAVLRTGYHLPTARGAISLRFILAVGVTFVRRWLVRHWRARCGCLPVLSLLCHCLCLRA